MSNPVFDRLGKDSRGFATFGSPAPTAPTYGQQGQATPSANDLDTMYGAPSATSVDTGRLTYDDVVVKTGLTFAVLLAGATVGWVTKSPALILAYAGFQGLFIGGISQLYEARFNGIVAQAVLGTLSVFVAVLVGYRSGKLRTSPRLNKIFFIAMIGYLLFSVANIAVVAFGGGSQRGGVLGLVIGAFAVLLASYSLVMDFEFIQKGVEQGAPAKFAWTAAFGLVVTLVWLYLEILRILSILRGD